MRVLVETLEDVIEEDVIDGVLLDGVSGGFDLGAEFTLRCDDGRCVQIHGWMVEVEVVFEDPMPAWIM